MIKNDRTLKEVFDTFNSEQKKIITELIASACANRMPRIKIVGGPTYIRSIFNSLDEYQLRAAYCLIGLATTKKLKLDDLYVLKGDAK